MRKFFEKLKKKSIHLVKIDITPFFYVSLLVNLIHFLVILTENDNYHFQLPNVNVLRIDLFSLASFVTTQTKKLFFFEIISWVKMCFTCQNFQY